MTIRRLKFSAHLLVDIPMEVSIADLGQKIQNTPELWKILQEEGAYLQYEGFSNPHPIVSDDQVHYTYQNPFPLRKKS